MNAAAFGTASGLARIDNGLALGRTLYLGHGTRAAGSDTYVFENAERMKAEGFTLYCPDPLHRPAMEDDSDLSKHSRAAGIAFASMIDTRAASEIFKDKTNGDAYNQAVAQKIGSEFRQPKSGVTADLILDYIKVMRDGVVAAKRPILNMKLVGTDDELSLVLGHLRKQSPGVAVGFQRSGLLGFDIIAVPLVQQTLMGLIQAVDDFGW